MAVDRGGLRYVIEAIDQFSATFQAFRGETAAARAEWASFKAEVEGLGRSAQSIRGNLTAIASATKAAADAAAKGADSNERAAKAADKRSAAEKKLERDQQRLKVAIEARALADERGIDVYKRLSRSATTLQAAEERLAKIEQSRARDALVAQLARERGIELSKRQAKVFDAEAEALKRATRAAQELAVRQALLSRGLDARGNRIAQFNAEAVATERVAAAQQRLAVIEALRKRGLDERGEKIKEFDAEAIATERVAAAQQRLSVVEALRRRGFNERGEEIKAKAFDAQAIAIERIAKAQQKLAIIEELRKRGAGPTGAPLRELSLQQKTTERVAQTIARLKEDLAFREASKGNAEIRKLREELGKVEETGNRIGFTFRRLIGIFAAFAAVRAAVSGFRDLIAESIRFNAVLEQANLGIATLLTAVGDVRDATGATVPPAQALALAQGEARRQTELLRLEALETAATFDQLVETFQTALAPGLKAGLDVNQVRKFSVAISQAAAAIGLAQNQLAEEIRSILSGTIQQRTTRIAVALGITNDDIRRAKEAGVLADFLNEKFEAFSVAGKESLNLFTVILSNLKDAILQLISAGGLEFFNEVKGLLKDIQDSVVEINDEGIQINPEAKEVVKALFDGLAGAVREARELRGSLNLGDILPIARAIGQAFTLAAQAVSILVQGATQAIGDLANIGKTVASQFEGFRKNFEGLIPLEDLRGLLVLAVRLATVFGTVSLAVRGIGLLVSGLLLPFSLVAASVKGIVTSFGILTKSLSAIRIIAVGILSPLGLWLFVIGAVVVALKKVLESVTGTELKFETIVKLVKVTLVGAIKLAASILLNSFTIVIGTIKGIFNSLVGTIIAGVQGVLQGIASIAEKLGITVDGLNEKIAALKKSADDSFASAKKDADSVAKSVLQIKNDFIAIANEAGEGFSKAFAENDSARDFSDFFKDVISDAKEQIGGLFDDVELDTSKVAQEIEPLSKLFENLPPTIGRANDELSETASTIKELQDDLKAAFGEFNVASQTSGLSGAVERQVQLALEAQVDARKKMLEIETALRQAETSRATAQTGQAQAQERLAALVEQERQAVEQGIRAGEQQLELTRTLAEVNNQQIIQQLALNKAKADGDADRVAAAEQELEALKNNAAFIQGALNAQKGITDEILKGLGPEAAARVQELISKIVSLKGQDAVATEEINQITAKRLELEGLVRDAVEQRIAAVAARELPALQNSAKELETQLANARLLAQFEESRLRPQVGFGDEEARIQAETALLTTKVEIQRQQNAADEAALQTQIEQTENAEARNALEQQLVALKQKNRLEGDLATAQLDVQKQKLEELRLIADSPVEAGVFAAFKQFAEETGTAFDATLRVAKGALDDFTSTVSQQISDAIFNTGDAQSAKERWATFFRGIANAVINELIRILIVKALVFAGLGTATPTPAPAPAAAKGGRVGIGRRGPRVDRGEGLAYGGRVRGRGVPPRYRPKGLDPRDRVPVWARVNEWFVAPEAVAALGSIGKSFMYALVNQRIDPLAAAQAITGSNIVHQQGEAYRQGFATGGAVRIPNSSSGGAGTGSGIPGLSAPGRDGGGFGPQRAVIVPSDAVMDQLLAGGRSATLRFMDENASDIANSLQPYLKARSGS